MRIVVQKVSKASVTSGGELVGSVEQGLCLLIGINRYDTKEIAQKLVKKTLALRLWSDQEDENKFWQRSVVDVQGGILAISQFTLYGNTDKGNRPDFHEAMKTEEARVFFEMVVQMFKDSYPNGLIQTGAFGQLMKVDIHNDGPVTILLDSQSKDK